MARLGFHQKVHHLVDFLLGMRFQEAHQALAESGWTVATMDRGWRLVERAGRARFTDELVSPDPRPAELFGFKKRWFPVVRLVLKKQPALAARLIGVLPLTNHRMAIFIIPAFIERLDALEQSPDPDERNARELLRARGLTKEVTEAALRLAEESHQPLNDKIPYERLDDEERAEAELWAFYVEWSGLARRAIKNRNLLRCLGLNKAGRPPGLSSDPGPSLGSGPSSGSDLALGPGASRTP